MFFDPNYALVTEQSPELPYRQREAHERKALHCGQRKLLLSEILFFTRYWEPEKVPHPVTVYAGAAPGNHIPFLASLFPQFQYHLYDPQPFAIKATKNITLYSQY